MDQGAADGQDQKMTQGDIFVNYSPGPPASLSAPPLSRPAALLSDPTHLINMPYDVLMLSMTPSPCAPTTEDRFICFADMDDEESRSQNRQ